MNNSITCHQKIFIILMSFVEQLFSSVYCVTIAIGLSKDLHVKV